MICGCCGHEHGGPREGWYLECIANLRADLAQVQADLKAERDRSWEGWEYSVTAENDFKECHTDLIESRKKELDAETRACAAEERAHDLEALLRYQTRKPK